MKAEEERNNWITQSNYFISKSRTDKLTLAQRRLLMYLISKVQPDDENFKTITFSQREFMEVCQLPDANYTNIRNELRDLATMAWWIEEDGHEYAEEWLRKGKQYTVIDKNTGDIMVTLSDSLQPYFLRLAKDFTSLTLGQYISLRCRYAVPLYQLAMSKGMRRPYWEFSVKVDELRAIMGADHKRFCDFNSAALKPAMDDICKNSDIIIDAEYKRKGRTIDTITFLCEVR